MKKVAILGSTGSIGTQALEVIEKNNLKITALSAYSQVEKLAEQAKKYQPNYVCIYQEKYADKLKNLLSGEKIEILTGMQGLCQIASDKNNDILLNSVVGMVGLLPTLKAIEAGVDIALANKETLVAGGELVIKQAREKNVKIYPVDSEHSAVFQCLQGNEHNKIRKMILTASGGPFFNMKKEQLLHVTAKDALQHPNWNMGNKITIDSATLMNKGLEFIEAKWLFDLEPDQIEIVVHRQSILHSAVEFEDFAVIGQMGVPDMKIPIQYALLYPERKPCPTKALSLTDCGILSFEKPDYETFVCLRSAIQAIQAGGLLPAIVNGANEEAVAYFLRDEIKFLQIGELVQSAMQNIPNGQIHDYEDILQADSQARAFVRTQIQKGAIL
ncbi:MAG: 1-deoxy-D-xylulose-5-phosphate reductoisomerase [Oscillospiraceae bacterium]|nr:1-deoxy-D-xylulose-5-phosphate reductoisomerase [Ruminococcus sp.]MDE6708852.1 1-deoxy-D-xylulose-5-phosphate reductoisomerase [Oscillospiraceae bacterium]